MLRSGTFIMRAGGSPKPLEAPIADDELQKPCQGKK
jgi:hypothetical protein